MARRVEVTRRILEITDPVDIRPPSGPPRVPFHLVEVHDPKLNRMLYETVGKPYHWTDRLRWRDADWVRWEGRVETHIIEVNGVRAGYFELEPGAGRVTLAYFGLYEPFHGLGIGGHALTLALRRGFEIAPIVQVSTNTLDGPNALRNYEARGMRERQVFVEHRVIND